MRYNPSPMRRAISTLILLLLGAARLAAQTVPGPSVTAAWNANPEPDIAGYHLIVDSTIYDVGNVTTFVIPVVPPGNHSAVLTATNTAGKTSDPSSPPVTFTVTGPTQDCSGLTIVVTSYTTPLVGGNEGQVVAKTLAPAPVLQMQVKLDQQVIGEINGTELRFVRAIGFATPRTPGTYNLFVTAADNRGCHTSTSAARPLVIQ